MVAQGLECKRSTHIAFCRPGTISDTIAGLDWLAENAVAPAVALLSLGVTTGQWSKVLENTVRAIVKEKNVTVVVAAGNSKVDACNIAPGVYCFLLMVQGHGSNLSTTCVALIGGARHVGRMSGRLEAKVQRLQTSTQ
jgi:subtilisin family serine protease